MTTAVKEGKLTIFDVNDPRVIEFNGILEDREKVRDEFDKLMSDGGFLAFKEVQDVAGTKNVQIRKGEFPMEEDSPRVTLLPHYQGG